MVSKLFPQLIDIPKKLVLNKSIEQDSTLIHGELVKLDTEFQDVCSPIAIRHGTELKALRLGCHPLMNHQLSMDILKSSVSSFNGSNWKNKSADYRISCVKEFIDNLANYSEETVKMLMWENCKPYKEAENELHRTIEYTNLTIQEYIKINKSTQIQTSAGFAGRVMNTPVGIVITMGPSNYPLYETYSLALPALLSGNSVILKIPRYGSLLHHKIVLLLKEYFPAGAINVIYGKNEDTVNTLMRTGEVNMLAYMGSNMFAEPLILSHPRPYKLKKLLGLDAKNPAIVLQEVDIEYAAKELTLGALAFNGQRCAAIKIIFAHSKIYDKLTERLKKEIEEQIIGMPWEDGVRITPIFDKNRILYLRTLFEDAISKGAVNHTSNGGKIDHTIFYPSLLSGITPNMRIYSEEQFGPIIPIVQYDDISTPLEYINNSEFGQQISIFGNDSKEIAKLSSILQYQCGRVNINTKCQRGPDIFPFTGKKNSGVGELSIHNTLLEFSSHAVIAGKVNDTSYGALNNI